MTRFVVDAMFGTLAKWLRVLGFDTVFAKDLEDEEIIAIAEQEERVLITRDKDLARKAGTALFLNSDVLNDQLKQVLEKYPADGSRLLTRCLLCNTILTPVEKAEVKDVPKGVLEREEKFWKCPECEKYYWPATHYENMAERAGELIS